LANSREVAQLTEILKQKVEAKTQRIRIYENRATHYIQIKMFKEDTNFTETWARRIQRPENPQLWQK
jgi:hypothetical protein